MNSKYKLLEDGACDDGDMILPAQTSSSWQLFTHWRPKRVHPYMSFIWNLLIYLLAFWGFINIVQLPAAYRDHLTTLTAVVHQHEGCYCGESVAEAMSMGCKFDALSMAWLPDHCRDDELTAEFDTTGKGPNGTWIYYADTARKVELDRAEVAAMGDDSSRRVHMDKDWHQIHCIYYWLKLQRTKTTGKIVEPRSNTESHIRHCGMVLLKPGYGTISGVALDTNED